MPPYYVYRGNNFTVDDPDETEHIPEPKKPPAPKPVSWQELWPWPQPDLWPALWPWPERKPVKKLLTDRRVDVLRLMANGSSNEEIAAVLYVSLNTVKTTVAHIKRILGTTDRTHTIAVAFAKGILHKHDINLDDLGPHRIRRRRKDSDGDDLRTVDP